MIVLLRKSVSTYVMLCAIVIETFHIFYQSNSQERLNEFDITISRPTLHRAT